ncbi:hypothetical protein GCM10027447_12590 [Glycomyces halotolerans]
MTERDYENATWVESELMPDGSYTVGIHYTPDQSTALGAPLARAYVREVTKAVACAEYGAAVLKQLTTIGVDDAHAAPTVGDIMGDRWAGVELPGGARIVPIIAQRDREPYVRIDIGGDPLTQWSPAEAMDHAVNVLLVAATVPLDTDYLKFLRGPLNLPEDKARGLVADLAEHREGPTR